MKIAKYIFLILLIALGINYTKAFDIHNGILFGIASLWFIILYAEIHMKNKELNTPRPVYLTE